MTAAGADQNVGIGVAVGAATGGTISPAMDLGRAGLQRLLSGSGGNTPIGPAFPVNDYNPNKRALRKLLTSIEDDTGLRGAAAVDVSKTCNYRWCQTGYFRSHKVGGRWRIDPDVDLESLSNPMNEQIRKGLKSRGW